MRDQVDPQAQRFCYECGEPVIPDPDGSDGVFVHDRDLGETSVWLDSDHTARPDDLDEQ